MEGEKKEGTRRRKRREGGRGWWRVMADALKALH